MREHISPPEPHRFRNLEVREPTLSKPGVQCANADLEALSGLCFLDQRVNWRAGRHCFGGRM
jgi:hypothetical protein